MPFKIKDDTMAFSKYLFFPVLALCFLSCGDDDAAGDTGDLTLNFKATFDGAPIVMFESETLTDYNLCLERLNFYMSSISLVKKNGGEFKAMDVARIDFTEQNENAAGAAAGVDLVLADIPIGEYTAIKFGIGVSEALNSTTPADYSPNDPLGNTAEHWTGWSSYIFAKIEGKADEEFNGTCDKSFAFHIGSDAIYRNKQLAHTVAVGNGGQSKMNLSIDVKRLFEEGSNNLDLTSVNSLNHLSRMHTIADNLASAISIIEN